MFDYIKGVLVQATPAKAVLDVQGVGYLLFIPLSHFSKLPAVGSPLVLYTAHVVREDSQKLYGFLTLEERELFTHLIDISGIGPKIALALIGHMDIASFRTAIQQANTQLISKIPGIGKKTAERLVIEMRDKVKKGGVQVPTELPVAGLDAQGVVADALSALLNLGYNTGQAQKAVQTALSKCESEPDLAQLITAALRSL